MIGAAAWIRLKSRWRKWRRDPVGFAAGLPSAPLAKTMLFALAGVTMGRDLADGHDRRVARAWRRGGVHLARSQTDGVFRFVDRGGRSPREWPDGMLVENGGFGMVVVASSDDGGRMTAAQLDGGRPGLMWLGRRSASCRVYRTDDGGLPDRIEVRPAGRAEALHSLRQGGVEFANALRATWPPAERPRWPPDARAYRAWISRNEPGPGEADAIKAWLARHPRLPRIDVLMRVSDPYPPRLKAAIQSLLAQIHDGWRLLVFSEGAPSPEVRLVLEAAAGDRRVEPLVVSARDAAFADWPAGADDAAGDVAIVLGQEDVLAPHALAMVAAALADHPDAAAAYVDEDLIDAEGRRASPAFKPDLDRARLEAQDYVGGALAVRFDLLRRVGGPGPDLARRVAEAGQGRILHLPHVLYHARARSTAPVGPEFPDSAAASDDLAEAAPEVLAIIPTRDRPALLEACVTGLLEQTDYPALSLCVIDNGSRSERALSLLSRLERTPRVRVVRIDAPFNFSALNNAAAAGATARLLAFVNDDILVAEPGWLKEMAARATSPDVGAVGAKLFYPNGSLQHAGIVLGLGPNRIAGHEFRGAPGESRGPQDRLQTTREVSAVTAACMVVERRKFESVGGFDEDAFPVAFNDVDLCLRLARRGYRTLWTPRARLMHLESATRGATPASAGRGQLASEVESMRRRWGPRLSEDPYYNPNLTLEDESFGLAKTSRAILPWR